MPRWKKLGRLFEPASPHPKLLTHAANPLPVHLHGDVFRIFYNGRDARQRSSVGYVDCDIASRRVLHVHPAPAFEHGPAGSFFADGVSIGQCYEAGGLRYMVFMGWTVPPEGHWYGQVGRLILHSDYSLTLDSPAPLIPLSARDPISVSYPCVIGGPEGGYEMWYGTTTTWVADNGEMIHVLRHARSTDGHVWETTGFDVPAPMGVAQAFSRPTVMRGEGGYEMWFSYRTGRGTPYRIGYATSPDGLSWRLRLDEAGIDVSDDGWDRTMIEYPFVFEHAGERYMLYCGDGFGQTGFGLAILERL